MLSIGGPADASGCQAHSLLHRVSVLDLYNQVGGSSCTPPDRWLSGLPQHGMEGTMVIPLAFHLRIGISGLRSATVAAAYVLVGGFLLRFTVLRSAPELLTRGPVHLGLFSTEDNRAHGARGADTGNHLPDFQPPSKLNGSSP